jgi:YidC/Oxa1 family membrane protein insertase
MEKRTMIALGLTIVLIFFMQQYFAPKEPVKQPAPQTQEGQQTTTEQAKVPAGGGTTALPQAQQPVSAQKPGLKPTREVVVETDLLKISLTDLGGGISSVKLKKYKQTVKGSESKEIIEDVKPYTYMPKVFAAISSGTYTDETLFKPDRERITLTDKPETLTFSGALSDGRKVRKIYTFYPGTYTVDMKIEVVGGDKGTSFDFAAITSKNDNSYTFKGPFVYTGKKFEQIEKIEKNIDVDKNYKYVGFDDGFFAFIWIPEVPLQSPVTIVKGNKDMPIIRCVLPGDAISGKMYFGPKKSEILKSLQVGAEKIVDFGWFDIIAKPLVLGLNFCNRLTHNYGIDIILLTIFIKIIFYPLSVKSYKSMNEMKKMQPVIAKLKEKYKDDRQKLNQEMMGIYKNKGINPMGGCLPMIIQIPVFFALYKGLSGAIELRHAPFMFWINDLSSPEDLYSFNVAGFEVPIRILPLIMGVTQLIQQKMTPTSADPMQEKIMLIMPIVFTFMFWGFPSGLVLYWLVNNVISIAQQYYINKKVS